MTVDPDEIRFELEHFSASEPGRLELTGRWFGIRGRRFVRPTLLLTLPGDDSERRSLADLEHKPWAAEDGELWSAAFPVDTGVTPETAASIQLSVAPDLTVEIGPDAGPRRRRRARGEERDEPLTADAAVDRERARRQDSIGERERVRRQDSIGERESVRRQDLIAERDQALAMRDRATAERDRAIRAGARIETTLRRRQAELETATEALTQARAEAERLRVQLSAAQGREPGTGPGEPRTAPEEPVRVTAHPRPVSGEAAAARVPVSGPRSDSAGRVEAPHSERPRNPSLRRRANWFVRILTVLVILGVIAAILLVVRSTLGR